MKTMENLQPGDEFTWKGQRYKVAMMFPSSSNPGIKTVSLSAWRFIEATRKYSSNTYLYGVQYLIADGAQAI